MKMKLQPANFLYNFSWFLEALKINTPANANAVITTIIFSFDLISLFSELYSVLTWHHKRTFGDDKGKIL